MRVNSTRPTVAAPECTCGNATQARAEIGEHIPLASAILIALLPKCPMCLVAWLGIIGSASISSWVNRVWGAPLTAGFLSIAIGTIALRAWRRRDSRPVWLGVLGGALRQVHCQCASFALCWLRPDDSCCLLEPSREPAGKNPY